jgi:hypothetical protein
MNKLIPSYDEHLPWFQLRVAQNLPPTIKVVTEIVNKLLPLGFVYQPKWVYYTVPCTNFVLTLIDKSATGNKIWRSIQYGLIAGATFFDSDTTCTVASCFYTFDTLYDCVTLPFNKKHWAVEDTIVQSIDTGLWWASETLHRDIPGIVAASLFFHSFYHGYKACRILPTATAVSLDTLEFSVQALMSVIRLIQAMRSYTKLKR